MLPLGKAAWATRWVSSGMGAIAWGCSDMVILCGRGREWTPNLQSEIIYNRRLSTIGDSARLTQNIISRRVMVPRLSTCCQQHNAGPEFASGIRSEQKFEAQ